GVPADRQRNDDLHLLSVAAMAPDGAMRTVQTLFHTLSDLTVSLGAPFQAPAVTSLSGGPYQRLRAEATLPADYRSALTIQYTDQAVTRSFAVGATWGWLGNETAVLEAPDLSAAEGWDNAWAPEVGGPGT